MSKDSGNLLVNVDSKKVWLFLQHMRLFAFLYIYWFGLTQAWPTRNMVSLEQWRARIVSFTQPGPSESFNVPALVLSGAATVVRPIVWITILLVVSLQCHQPGQDRPRIQWQVTSDLKTVNITYCVTSVTDLYPENPKHVWFSTAYDHLCKKCGCNF